MQLILAEKPSVARDLARVLGVRPSGRGAFEGTDRVITWCVGHLVELDEPASYDARWKAWRLDTLPMLPEKFRLRPVASSKDQLGEVKRLLVDRRFTEVVNACDAGREGELIFRYVYELAGSRLPVRRLWISSMTDEAIRQGMAQLRPGADYDRLGDAARCRSEADWLVGLNATRAVTVRHRTGGESPLYSIGRVQTPTLALVVARDEAIARFVPADYWEVRGRFTTTAGQAFDALWTHEPAARGERKVTRLGRKDLAGDLVQRLQAVTGTPKEVVVESVNARRTREPPPLLFDLTSLQRTANRRFGLSATRTLEIAQALYETHKILTYPRTDARYLSRDLAGTLPKLFGSLAAMPDYARFAQRLERELQGEGAARIAGNRRVFDDAKIQDHHAIIPTGKRIDLAQLSRDEQRIFDLVARRFLSAFFPDAEFAATDVVVRVGARIEGAPIGASGSAASPPPPGTERAATSGAVAGTGAGGGDAPREEPVLDRLPPPPDRFVARGRVRLEAGWQEVAGFGGDAGKGESDPEAASKGEEGATLPILTAGDRLAGTYASTAKQTRPPPHLTEATLLAAMETAGRAIEDEELRAAMKESGLGTPATRASTIETLIKRGFMTRAGKSLESTNTGRALVRALPVASLSSPELTGSWEARLGRMARGLDDRAAFMKDIGRYVAEVVAAVRAAPVDAVMASAPMVVSGRSVQGRGSFAVDRRRESTAGAALDGDGATERPRFPKPVSEKKRAPARGDKPAGRGRKAASPNRTALASASAEPMPARGSRGADRTSASAPASASRKPEGAPITALGCPRCRQGTLVIGKRGWGCSRWRLGCGFVVWFALAGKRLSEAQLRELIDKGRTRKLKWPSSGSAIAGHLVLDLGRSPAEGAVRFEPA